MKDQKTKENREYWKSEEESIIKEWSDKALCYQWLHTRCREIYQIKNYMDKENYQHGSTVCQFIYLHFY